MDNLKCLSDHVSTHASVDFIDACETLHKELLKSMKIAKKFKEELKLANLEKEELVVRLDEFNKKNEFLRNQISSQDEKMKSLEQELVESKVKIENLTSTKPAIDNKSVSVSLKPKTEKVYIPHFKRNNKENAYFARLDKCNSSNVDAEVSKLLSKPTVREHNKSVFVPTYHFCGVSDHIRPNCHKLKFKNFVFQYRISDDISPAISPYKLFYNLLKNLSLLACERNLQDFSLSQKIGEIPQIHSASHGFSPTKPKTCAI